MDTQRLIQDITDCVSNTEFSPQNRLDASLVLVSNLITNTLSGDFSESNLDIFLDRRFLILLSKKKIRAKLYGAFDSLFSYGFFLLLNQRELRAFPEPEESHILRAVLLESYRLALPVGEWDDFPIQSWNSLTVNSKIEKESASSRRSILAFRPDLVEIIDNTEVLEHWFQCNGFYELPLFRTSLRKTLVEGKTSFEALGPAGTAYCYQELAVSVVPQENDLPIHGTKFKRWLCIPGSLIIFKDEETGKIKDKRWLHKETTFVVKTAIFGSILKMSVATLGGNEPVHINIYGADRGKAKQFGAEGALFVEIGASKWVENIRITISCNAPYVVNLD